MYCSSCGIKNKSDANFCWDCGAPLMKKEDFVDSKSNKESLKVIAWILNIISLFFFPVIFAPAGFIAGYLYKEKNETQGLIIMIAAVIFGFIGMLFGFSVGLQMY